MIAVSVIFAQYLQDENIFTAPGDETTWPLYISAIPDADTVENDLGGIYDTEGMKDGREMAAGNTLFHFGIQVRTRSEDYQDGWDKLNEVVNLFSTVANVAITVNSVNYSIMAISQISSILSLGIEAGTKRRYNFTVNFLTTIKEI